MLYFYEFRDMGTNIAIACREGQRVTINRMLGYGAEIISFLEPHKRKNSSWLRV